MFDQSFASAAGIQILPLSVYLTAKAKEPRLDLRNTILFVEAKQANMTAARNEIIHEVTQSLIKLAKEHNVKVVAMGTFSHSVFITTENGKAMHNISLIQEVVIPLAPPAS